MENAFSTLTSYIPAGIDIISMVKFIAVFALAVLALGLVVRLIRGKRSSLNHAVSSAMGIFFMYAVTVMIYTFQPGELASFLSPLPYVQFSGEYMMLFSFQDAAFSEICSQVLSMIILAFLVNLLDSFIPKGEKVVRWYLLRFLGVVLSMVVHYAATWAFNAFLPGVLVAYAPTILLVLLIGALLVGLLNIVLSVVLTVVNPIIGALYAFFFSSKVGKQLSKAVLTTLLLTAVVVLLEHFGYTVICIAESALGVYIPLVAALLVLWYLIGHIL